MFEKRVLRGISGPKRDGLTGEWRRLYNVELSDLYSSSGDQIKKNEIGATCCTHRKTKGAYRILVEKPAGKILGKPRHIGKDNIATNVQAGGCGPGLD